MFFVKLRCNNCRGIFDIYPAQVEPEKAAKCPFCETEMPQQQWNDLVNCFRSLVNWNRIASKNAAEHRAPLFTAEIRQHFVRRERSEE